MTQAPDDRLRHRLQSKAEAARVLYDGLTDALKRRIRILEDGDGDPLLDKTFASDLTQHRKALQSLIEQEVKLDALDTSATGGGAIDLDAARDDLCARLAALGK